MQGSPEAGITITDGQDLSGPAHKKVIMQRHSKNKISKTDSNTALALVKKTIAASFKRGNTPDTEQPPAEAPSKNTIIAKNTTSPVLAYTRTAPATKPGIYIVA